MEKNFSFKKTLLLNSIVGGFTDEIEFLFKESDYALRNKGIFLKFTVDHKKRAIFFGKTKLERISDLHRVLRGEFSILSYEDEISDQIWHNSRLNPYVLEDETLSFKFSYKNKNKSVSVSVDQKTFHEKTTRLILNKDIYSYLGFEQVQDFRGKEEIICCIQLESMSKIRPQLPNVFTNFCMFLFARDDSEEVKKYKILENRIKSRFGIKSHLFLLAYCSTNAFSYNSIASDLFSPSLDDFLSTTGSSLLESKKREIDQLHNLIIAIEEGNCLP